MPITAKLSQRFYQKFGDEVTNELVDWLNAIDTSYRQEFRELFEAHFGRLEAQLDELRAEMRGQMAELRAELHGQMGELRAETKGLEARVDAKLETLKAELLRWMFLFWVGTIGTVLAILKL